MHARCNLTQSSHRRSCPQRKTQKEFRSHDEYENRNKTDNTIRSSDLISLLNCSHRLVGKKKGKEKKRSKLHHIRIFSWCFEFSSCAFEHHNKQHKTRWIATACNNSGFKLAIFGASLLSDVKSASSITERRTKFWTWERQVFLRDS
jgi:hypothetical protein